MIIQVGQAIGALPTVALLVAESLLGAWIVKREGRSAWVALRQATASGRLPTRELADAGLVLVGGTLLLTPGFVTDVFGFFLVLPPTRPLARRALAWFVARRAARTAGRRGVSWTSTMGTWPGGGPAGRAQPRRVVPGETPTGNADPQRVVPGETLSETDDTPDSKGPGRGAGG